MSKSMGETLIKQYGNDIERNSDNKAVTKAWDLTQKRVSVGKSLLNNILVRAHALPYTKIHTTPHIQINEGVTEPAKNSSHISLESSSSCGRTY